MGCLYRVGECSVFKHLVPSPIALHAASGVFALVVEDRVHHRHCSHERLRRCSDLPQAFLDEIGLAACGVSLAWASVLSPEAGALTRVELAYALFGGRDAAVELGEGVRPRLGIAEVDAQRGEQVARRA